MKKLFTLIVLAISISITASAEVHYVKAGETAFSIARLHGLTLSQLADANPTITDLSKIKVGQAIQLGLDMDRLASAFIWVESKGDDKAIGDNGNAVGCLQFWPIMVKEANRLGRTAYTNADRYDRAKSVAMFKTIMSYHKVKTVREAVRVWNRNAPEKYIRRYEQAYALKK